MTEETETKKTKTYYELQFGVDVDSCGYWIGKEEGDSLPRDVQEGRTLLYYFTKKADAERFAKKLEEQRFLFAEVKRKTIVMSLTIGVIVGWLFATFLV